MRKIIARMDIPLFITMLIFIVLGLVMVYSASSIAAVVRYGYEPYHFFIRQAIFVVFALIAGIIVLKIPTKAYQALSWPLMLILIALLIYVLFFGDIHNSARSWIDLKFFSIQPSEFAKSIIIMFSAVYYNNLHYNKVKNIYAYFFPLAITIVIFGLVYKQPDLGSALIIAGISFMMFISIPDVLENKGKVFKILGVDLIIFVLVFLLLGKSLLNGMQSNRFNFQNPCSRYTESSGYQVCNGFIAINNGDLFGVGLGHSTQKYLYLPESHTDFIFPIIVEELGLITGTLVIIGYAFILYRILKIAKNSENLRCSVLAYGTFWYFTAHIIINLMGVMALIPLTGVPLPLLSYGGSFTINAIVMLFVVERVCIENKINKTKREIKAL